MLEAFDVPKRVTCVAKRDTTNTPLHAFVLLNGVQFVEAARVLAEKLLAETEGDAAATLALAFERLTSRPPDQTQLAILERMHAGQLEWYAARPEQAAKFVGVGETKRNEALPAVEVAAAAGVINALMNYDESVVKR